MNSGSYVEYKLGTAKHQTGQKEETEPRRQEVKVRRGLEGELGELRLEERGKMWTHVMLPP